MNEDSDEEIFGESIENIRNAEIMKEWILIFLASL